MIKRGKLRCCVVENTVVWRIDTALCPDGRAAAKESRAAAKIRVPLIRFAMIASFAKISPGVEIISGTCCYNLAPIAHEETAFVIALRNGK